MLIVGLAEILETRLTQRHILCVAGVSASAPWEQGPSLSCVSLSPTLSIGPGTQVLFKESEMAHGGAGCGGSHQHFEGRRQVDDLRSEATGYGPVGMRSLETQLQWVSTTPPIK
ncbi:hypothetical protein AAY473_013503 [Plecturocebus cupreus]